MYKYVTCPQCGQILCLAKEGSEVKVTCNKCRQVIKGMVEKDGSVHTLPVDDKKAM